MLDRQVLLEKRMAWFARCVERLADEILIVRSIEEMAKRHGISLNKLFEELSTTALAEFDVEARFRGRAGHGSVERGLSILDKLG